MDYYQRSSKGLNTVPKRWIILGVGSIVTLWLLWFGVFSGPSLQAGRPLDIDSLQGVSDQAVAAILRLPTTFSLFRAPGDLRGQRKGSTSSHLSSLVDLSQKLSTFPRPKCAIRPWHNNRYAHLPRSNSTVFLALNLINAEIVMPTFLHELPAVLDFLGPNRVHVSIVENGSTDKTPTYLHLLSRALDTLGTSYSIIAKGDSEHFAKENGHRISVLAAVRNAAMAPLYDGKVAKKMLGERFNTVLFINDMVYCAVDVLEVLMQHSEQGADMACAVDWSV